MRNPTTQQCPLNFTADQTVANAVLAPVSVTGRMCLYSNVSTDVIGDLNGWIAVPAG
jgi:hypothetical protein